MGNTCINTNNGKESALLTLAVKYVTCQSIWGVRVKEIARLVGKATGRNMLVS
jgi:hypothetical protein